MAIDVCVCGVEIVSDSLLEIVFEIHVPFYIRANKKDAPFVLSIVYIPTRRPHSIYSIFDNHKANGFIIKKCRLF